MPYVSRQYSVTLVLVFATVIHSSAADYAVDCNSGQTIASITYNSDTTKMGGSCKPLEDCAKVRR